MAGGGGDIHMASCNGDSDGGGLLLPMDHKQLQVLEMRVAEPELVHPAEPVAHQVYYLSNLDQNIAVPMKTVWFFNGQQQEEQQQQKDPAALLKDSLRKLLVHLFFLAGRIGLSPDYRLQIDFQDQGLVFVEAVAEHCITEFGDLSKPAPFMQQLVYEPPPSENILGSPPTLVQVTKFKCGGFALGLNNNHCTLDGLAVHKFMCTWGKLARGLEIPHAFSIDRSALKPRSPLQPEFSHEEFYDLEDLSSAATDAFLSINPVHDSFELSPPDMEALKKSILDEGGDVTKVTTFEALTAFTWRARMSSLNLIPAQKTRVFFSVDVRKKLSPPLPEHFMGNGIVLTFATTTVGELCDKPLSFTVKLVQDAIAFVTDKYVRSAIDYFELSRTRPALVASFIVTSWLRLPFHETDFGWGPAVSMSPASLPDQGVVLFISSGKDRKSATVILGLPNSSAMDKFGGEVNKAHVN